MRKKKEKIHGEFVLERVPAQVPQTGCIVITANRICFRGIQRRHSNTAQMMDVDVGEQNVVCSVSKTCLHHYTRCEKRA